MNEVDTSQQTINDEFTAAEQAIGIEPEITDDEQGRSNVAGAGRAGATQQTVINDELEREAQIAIAQQMINTTLRLSIGMFANVTIEDKHTNEAAHAYAVLIIKYFPGGLFGLLDKYKEELAAGTATLLLVKAVSQAKAQQEEERQREEQVKKRTQTAPSESSTFTFTENTKESEGEAANG